VKALIVSFYFPPAGGGGVQRPLKLATHLPELGVETHVLAPDDPRWIHRDDELQPPTLAWVHRARYVGTGGRKPAEELHGTQGLQRLSKQAQLFGRRFLVPDENVSWNLTAIPAAIRIVRSEGIDVVVTTSPPSSVHLIGAAVKRATGVKWVADLRDSLVAHPHRRAERLVVRAKEQGEHAVARLVARGADAITCVSEAIADEIRERAPAGPVTTIANGSDFDDFAGLARHPSERFRLTHTGSFFGKRDPRPFLTALKESGLEDVVVRFLGDFRAADREWAETLELGDRLELHPFASRRRSLELQRDSEALLLLIPDAGGRGRGVLSGKVFEYLAAERPILAVVPPGGAAAGLIRDAGAGVVVAPDDVDGMAAALRDLHGRWRAGSLEEAPLAEEWRRKVSRRARSEEFAHVLEAVVG
jgi:glycosyltransferase involved in cell wall biosynthesis